MGKRPAQTDLQKTKSKRARRILQAREPKEVSALSVAELPSMLPRGHSSELEMKVRSWCDACRLLQVEDAKKTLLLAGNKTSQVVKDILSDMQKLKPLVRLQ